MIFKKNLTPNIILLVQISKEWFVWLDMHLC